MPQALVKQLQQWAEELGFQQVGISSIELSQAETRLFDWLHKDYHGEMAWMATHGTKRSRPAELVPKTLSVISLRMDYLPANSADAVMMLNHPERAYISRYALGRDYHKVIRQRLEQLAQKLKAAVSDLGYRVFTDSAPVLEKPIAIKAGLGWMGKHTNILSRTAGSWFFLGEIYTDLALAETGSVKAHCGQCQACLEVCPTQAIIAPYQLDARRCISYLTIEYAGVIPIELRPLIGNRIYGCDDCQLICPWNRFAKISLEADFQVRHGLDQARLLDLWAWDETTFLKRMEGSAIRRIGYRRWLRNLALALGNAPANKKIYQALVIKRTQISDNLLLEHIDWALAQQHCA
jgi:epoxyqueuosine reductase